MDGPTNNGVVGYMPEIDGVVRAVNHAAQQSDRWLLVAVLVVVAVAGFYLVRFIFTQNKALVDSQMLTMKEMTQQYSSAMTHLGEVLERNTAALAANAAESKALREHCSDVWRLRGTKS